jgi:serine/threonine-protein kinase
MLSGRMTFSGETISDVVAAVLEREPAWQALPPATPSRIHDVLRRCLRKDAGRRMRDIGDVRLEVSEALGTPESRTSAAAVEPAVARRAAAWRIAAAIGAILVAGAAGYVLGIPPRTVPTPKPLRRFDVVLPATQRLASLDFPTVAIAPDGSLVVYVATRGGRPQLFARALSSVDPVPMPGTADAISPFFSADGRWVAFFADGKLKKVPVSGGTAITICDARIGFGGTWSPDDHIIFSPATGAGLMRVPAAGGTPTRATTLDAAGGEFSHRWPELLPDGDTVLFTVGTLGSWDDAQIVAQSLSTGRRAVLVQGGTDPHYLQSGYLVYAHGGALMAAALDVKSLKTSGQPFRVLDNIVESPDGAAQLAIARSGDAVYVPAAATSTERRLLSVDRSGTSIALAAPPRAYSTPRLSPDGGRLVVTINGSGDDLWLYESATGALQQLTFDSDAAAPVWMPGAPRVTFSSSKDGPPNLFSIGLDPPNREERLASSEYPQTAGSWSPDGRTLAYAESRPATGRDIWLLPLDGDRKPVAFRATTFDETAPKFSPDGRWLAFVSNESGRNEVYVSRIDDPERGAVQISRDGGSEPVWSHATRELIYRAGSRFMAVAQQATSGEWSRAKPRLLFERAFERGDIDVANYDISPDGQRFILIEAAGHDDSFKALRVVLNWADSVVAAPR